MARSLWHGSWGTVLDESWLIPNVGEATFRFTLAHFGPVPHIGGAVNRFNQTGANMKYSLYIAILASIGDMWERERETGWRPADGGPMDSQWVYDIAYFCVTT